MPTMILFIFVSFYPIFVFTASCCSSNTNDISTETLSKGVDAMDRLHRFWFQRRLLMALRIDDIPSEANLWRRRRDQQRRSISSAERISNGMDEDESFRKYTLRIVGIPDTHHSSHHHRRHNTHQRRKTDNIEYHSYSFFSKIPLSSFTSQQESIETELEKAELELWPTNQSMAHLHFRRALDTDNDESSSDRWSQFHVVQGYQNKSIFVSDVTHVFRSFWSNTDGANVTITLKAISHQKQHHVLIDDEIKQPLVLKLSLIEKSIKQRSQRKRSIGAFQTSNSTIRRAHRQMIVQDCENQWDAAFLRETAGHYDDLMPCCRRRVHIDFSELGWGSWVVSPPSFDSYYCMGRCTNFGGFASADTDGAAFYTEAMNLYRDARNSGLTPCCSPVKFSPLTITVLIGDNEEMTQTLEDVVVKQCGCM